METKTGEEKEFRSGYVSIIGRPNVGKSTLLNAMLGEKIAIVTPKPQTTRNKIIGINNLPDSQIIFIDTPGIHKPKHRLGEAMIKTARQALAEVDLILFMVEPHGPRESEKSIFDLIRKVRMPVFLLINKIDTRKKTEMLPVIEEYQHLYPFSEIIPLSALKKDGMELLMKKIYEYRRASRKFSSSWRAAISTRKSRSASTSASLP